MDFMMSLIKKCSLTLSIGTLWFVSSVNAQQITGTDILNLLIDNEVLSQEQAQVLVDKVRNREGLPKEKDPITGQEVVDLLLENGVISQASADALAQKLEKRTEAIENSQKEKKDLSSEEIRIPYIPQYVQDEMEQKLKFAVESDIVEAVQEDVVRVAQTYGWGIKEAPSWVHKVKISGDGRVRLQSDIFPEENGIYGWPDIHGINDNEGIENLREAFNNTQDDRHRMRSRFRLMVKAKPFETVEWGLRLTTGSAGNPVSANQTLGNFGKKWESSFDLGYIKYKAKENNFELYGGRFKSPMLKTDLIFDSDMTFEGVGASYYFLRNNTIYEDYFQLDPYVMMGVYPIQEINQFVVLANPEDPSLAGIEVDVPYSNADDKFLYAIQVGTNYRFVNNNKFSFALSMYQYENITGKYNEIENGDLQDVTLSGFYQYGNSYFNIANDPTDSAAKLALASKYSLANATVTFRMANFFPVYIDLHADYVKNIAFDREEIDSLVGDSAVPQRDIGYQFGIQLGTAQVKYRRDWQISLTRRYLEGDAVLDAFADSDFLGGRTDAEGLIFSAKYAFLENLVGSLRYSSANVIDADLNDELFAFSLDTLFIDISAQF